MKTTRRRRTGAMYSTMPAEPSSSSSPFLHLMMILLLSLTILLDQSSYCVSGQQEESSSRSLSSSSSFTCDSDFDCAPNGTCDTSSSLKCQCDTGFTGQQCEQPVCPLDCQNGSSCKVIDIHGGIDIDYYCDCLPDYTGGLCQTKKEVDDDTGDEKKEDDNVGTGAQAGTGTTGTGRTTPRGKEDNDEDDFGIITWIITLAGLLIIAVVTVMVATTRPCRGRSSSTAAKEMMEEGQTDLRLDGNDVVNKNDNVMDEELDADLPSIT